MAVGNELGERDVVYVATRILHKAIEYLEEAERRTPPHISSWILIERALSLNIRALKVLEALLASHPDEHKSSAEKH